jgi:hypothetical protein
LYLSDGSVYKLEKKVGERPVYPKIQDKPEVVVETNPEVVTGYKIGTGDFGEIELEAAKGLLLVPENTALENLDEAIKSSIKNKKALGMLEVFKGNLANYQSRLIRSNYFVGNPAALSNLKDMIDEINRYISEVENESIIETVEQENENQDCGVKLNNN